MNSNHPSPANYASPCGALRRMIPLLVGGEMAAKLQPSMESHLRDCSACGAEYNSYRAQNDMLKSLSLQSASSPVPDLWAQLASKLKPRQ